MPLATMQPHLNPTVEEVHDEMDSNNADAAAPQSEQPKFSWPQICSQHEVVLNSHLMMLNHVRGQFTSDAQAFRVLTTMIDRTNELVTQFEGIKEQIIPQACHRFHSAEKVPADGHSSSSRHESKSTRNGRRKRQRLENAEKELEAEVIDLPLVEAQRSQKRKRVGMAIPGDDEDVSNALPVSLETEDISEEVQRRLEIKEEQRKRRNAKPEKRKRESLTSNGSSSSFGGMTKRRKRFKVGDT